MSVHITQIGKHKFICGLFWQSLSRPRELAKEAADLAKKIDFDLMVLRKDHATAQVGFAHSREGARKKMFSLAATVSKTLSIQGAYFDGEKQPVHDWLGAFKLPDGKWAYFAVRDANFLPNGDFAGTREEVLERLHGDYGLGGWNAVIGDAELENYGFHNFNAKTIEELIPHKKNGQIRVFDWWGLRPVERTFPWRSIALVGMAAFVAATGGTLYWQQMQKKKRAEEMDRAIEEARRKMNVGNEVPAAMKPWASLPSPLTTARACADKFTHIVAGGWLLKDYVCTNEGVQYTWSRQNSNISLLLAQVPEANIDLSGDTATYTEPLKLVPGKDAPLLEYKKLIEPALSQLQMLNLSPKFTLRQPPAPPQNTQNGAPPPPLPDWKELAFQLNTDALPITEVAAIINRPGVRLEKVIYRGGAWSIEGVMYAK